MKESMRRTAVLCLAALLFCICIDGLAETEEEAILKSALNTGRRLETVYYLYTLHEGGETALYDEEGQPCGSLPDGSRVALTDKRQGERTFVLFDQALSGWVENDDLTAALPEGVAAREADQVSYHYVLADDRMRDLFTPVEIYEDAERSVPCGSLETGTLVTVCGWQGDMAHFTLGDLDAWIPAFNLLGDRPDEVNQAVIAAQIERARAYAEAQKEAYSGGAIFYIATGNDDPLKLRSAPNADAETLGRYKNGTPVAVQEEENGWARVIVDGQEGYMMRKYLVAAPEGVDAEADGGQKIMVVQTGNNAPLKMRAHPDGNSDIVGTFPNGTRVTVHTEQNGWAFVTAGEQSGYMMLKYLIPASDDN